MNKTEQLTVEEFLSENGIDNPEELTLKEKLRLLKNIKFIRKVDLDMLDFKIDRDSSDTNIKDCMLEERKCQIDIINVSYFIREVKLQRRQEIINKLVKRK